MKTYTKKTAIGTYHALIEHLIGMMNASPEKVFNFAFSGGDVLWPLFDVWAYDYGDLTPWHRMRIYWTDEHHVPMEHSDSNYGIFSRLLIDKVSFPSDSVFPILCGSASNLKAEAVRYAGKVRAAVPMVGGIPVFDAVLLGVEPDGHVASLYPGQEHLLASSQLYVACTNPYSGQRCVTMTGTLLLAASQIILLAVGKGRAGIVHDVLKSGDTSPLSYIAHHAADVRLFIDVCADGGQ